MEKPIKNQAVLPPVSILVLVSITSIGVLLLLRPQIFFLQNLITSCLFIFSLVMTLQSSFSLYWMLYAWKDVDRIKKDRSPEEFIIPHYSFTALVPARHEEKVIGDTIKAIDQINYPETFKEILVICRTDDQATIEKVQQTINELGKTSIRLVTFNDLPINKPHGLNIALKEVRKDIVVIFDAEDQPHPQIYNIVNTVMTREKADVVQSGVQLMNFRSSWFATLNVLEYFFWFKSTLHYFAQMGMIPLGGNTVFFKKRWLTVIGGWDETCLTEDADIGIRLSIAGAKTRVVYDEQHVTEEETPPNLTSFIKQRTRWNQGFIQILLKKEWLQLPTLTKKLLAGYVLILPQVQAGLFLLVPISLIIVFTVSLPVWVVIFSIIPFYLLLLQLLTYCIGIYLFTKDYHQKFHFWYPLKILLTFYPYQIILGLSAFRAVRRSFFKENNWEKTQHINAHRLVGGKN